MPKLSPSEEGFKLVVKWLEDVYGELMNPRIEVVFSDKVIKKGGEPKAATVQVIKADSNAGYFANKDEEEPQDLYLMKISKPIWDRLNLPQKDYVVDHELSHCFRGENNELRTKGHDIEENFPVMKRHPLNIMKDVYTMARIVQEKLKKGERLDPPQNSLDFGEIALLKGNGDGDDDEDGAFH